MTRFPPREAPSHPTIGADRPLPGRRLRSFACPGRTKAWLRPSDRSCPSARASRASRCRFHRPRRGSSRYRGQKRGICPMRDSRSGRESRLCPPRFSIVPKPPSGRTRSGHSGLTPRPTPPATSSSRGDRSCIPARANRGAFHRDRLRQPGNAGRNRFRTPDHPA